MTETLQSPPPSTTQLSVLLTLLTLSTPVRSLCTCAFPPRIYTDHAFSLSYLGVPRPTPIPGSNKHITSVIADSCGPSPSRSQDPTYPQAGPGEHSKADARLYTTASCSARISMRSTTAGGGVCLLRRRRRAAMCKGVVIACVASSVVRGR